MSAINDNANVFVNRTLELFNQMEVVVARDGDVAWAQACMSEALLKVIGTTQLSHSVKTGASVSRRNA